MEEGLRPLEVEARKFEVKSEEVEWELGKLMEMEKEIARIEMDYQDLRAENYQQQELNSKVLADRDTLLKDLLASKTSLNTLDRQVLWLQQSRVTALSD